MIETTDITKLFGNNSIRAIINQLLSKNEYPQFSILCGPMGVGKSTIANIIAKDITQHNTSNNSSIHIINCAAKPDIANIESNFLRFSPTEPIVLLFEEFHGLMKEGNEQTILLNILDKLPTNIFIVATTTELHKIQRPIISRGVKFEFKLLSIKEMQQLLNSYLSENKVSFNQEVKNALIHASRGIPRDLLKTTDLIIKGELSDSQIIDLLEHVSDNSLYILFSSLKSESVSFSLTISDLLLNLPSNQLQAMRDFWSRFILINKGSTEITIDKNISKSLSELYNNKEIMLITEMLLNTDNNKLILDLLRLNMILTNTTNKNMVGVQKVQQSVCAIDSKATNTISSTNNNQKLNKHSLQQFLLK